MLCARWRCILLEDLVLLDGLCDECALFIRFRDRLHVHILIGHIIVGLHPARSRQAQQASQLGRCHRVGCAAGGPRLAAQSGACTHRTAMRRVLLIFRFCPWKNLVLEVAAMRAPASLGWEHVQPISAGQEGCGSHSESAGSRAATRRKKAKRACVDRWIGS